MAKINENDMNVDNANGQIAAVNTWPSVKSPHGGVNQLGIPAGYYTPSQMRKKKDELRKQGKKFRATMVEAKRLNPKLAKPILKGPILKEPRTNKVKFAESPSKMTLQSILDKSS